MTRLRIPGAAALVGALLVACQPTEQQLPFDTAAATVTRPVPAAGATFSSPLGASFRLAPGSVPAGTEVTLASIPAPAADASGAPASGHAFQLGAAGVSPALPIAAELRLAPGAADPWLAAVVVRTADGVREIGDVGVDVAAGVARVRIASFGAVGAVLPAAAAVVEVERIGAPGRDVRTEASALATAVTPTRALLGGCGGPGTRCEGLRLAVGDNLFDYATRAAVVFPRVSGRIDIAGLAAAGELVLDAPLRLRLNSGAAAASIPVRVTISPTSSTLVTELPGRITLSNVRVRVESSLAPAEQQMTLVVDYEGAAARVTVQQNIGANFSRVSESAAFRATIPLIRVP